MFGKQARAMRPAASVLLVLMTLLGTGSGETSSYLHSASAGSLSATRVCSLVLYVLHCRAFTCWVFAYIRA